MPKLLVAVGTDFSETRHHGGGFMMKGGFDIKIAELSPKEYANKLVSGASTDVAYRTWKDDEILMLDTHYYLQCVNKIITLHCVGVVRKEIMISDNNFWRNEARKFIAETCVDEKVDGCSADDIADAKLCNQYGSGL